MATLSPTPITAERARQTLCRFVEQWCERGVSNVKVRVNTKNEEPEDVWFYGRVGNVWEKLPETVEGSEFALLISMDLERLTASPHTEECQVRRKQYLDRIEFEIKFHHDDIVAHQGKQLSSYLFGILFRERHDTPDAKRQGIRRGGKSRIARV